MRKLLLSICILGSCVCFIYVGNWLLSGWRQSAEDTRLAEDFHQRRYVGSEQTTDENDPGASEEDRFLALRLINPDIIGWLMIAGTSIDYPVVQGEDNRHYLSVDFYGQKNKRGAIFQDYRHSEANPLPIIYGHHMKDGTMFHDLTYYRSKEYLSENQEIIFILADGAEKVYLVQEILYWDFTNEHERSFVDYFIDMNAGGGKLLALVTCDNAAADARLIVIAREQDG